MSRLSNPLLIAFLNILAGILVAHGIIDDTFKDQLITLMDNAIAAAMTLGIAVYTIYKSYEAHKHHVSLTTTQQITTTSTPSQTHEVTKMTQQAEMPIVKREEHTGLPIE